MKRLSTAALVAVLAHAATCWADVKPVAIAAPKTTAWVGQAAVFSVELRAEGSFDSAASFSLPELPQCVIVKLGSPVVGTKEIEGDSWFVQTHEFALFSQRDGDVVIPPFEVRFSNKKGFVGPAEDHAGKTDPLTLTFQRPEGADADAFLVTTDDFTVTESWDPKPGPAKAGDIFHRTITQKADQQTGMALAPPSTAASAGVRVHRGQPEITDNTERGALRCTRRDTLTYVLQGSGELSVPAIKYVWWNPDKKEFGSTTLPAVTFDVAAPPSGVADPEPQPTRAPWIFVAAAGALLLGLAASRHDWLDRLQELRRALNPPDRVAARRLLTACRTNDARAAESAWLAWTLTQQSGAPLPPALDQAVADLNRCLYGRGDATEWRGDNLRRSFESLVADRKRGRPPNRIALPPLNPEVALTRPWRAPAPGVPS